MAMRMWQASIFMHVLSEQAIPAVCRPVEPIASQQETLGTGSKQRSLRLALHDPMDTGVADFQLGGDGPCGHTASRHLKNLAAINDKALAAKMIGAALCHELLIGGAGTLRPANR